MIAAERSGLLRWTCGRILCVVLIANAATFGVDTIGRHAVGSLTLQADAATSGVSLRVAKFFSPAPPDPAPMGLTGALALAVNLGAVTMLLPMRNDAFGNILVILAAGAPAATRSPWPDFAVGAIMCLLFLSGSWSVYSQARRESAAAVVG